MDLAIVGCGFVADMYLKTLALHPELKLAGVYDRDPERTNRFARFYGSRAYSTFDELLADKNVTLIANLTNPKSHFEVSRRALESAKHVYSEKPLAMSVPDARQLVEFAKALREQAVGKVRAVYAEMDDGLVHRMPFRRWLSESGTPWPHQDEFEVGCTLEHAGYCLTWLAAFFGPAKSVTAFASVQIPDKSADVPAEKNAADFSCACIEFANGVVARLTCSIIAPHDHHLRIFGDNGVLWTPDTWFYRAPVYVRRFITIRRRMMLNPIRKRIPLVGKHLPVAKYRGASQMDFCRGIADMADAIARSRPARLSARFSLHVNELALAIHEARQGRKVEMTTTFAPLEPMDWAK
jgi:predicted dehydrogenase